MKLNRIQDIVELMLSRDALTRDSDDYLYIQVCEYMRPTVTDRPLKDVFLHMGEYQLPSYESVGRARRKLQAEKPWLKASDAVRRYRADNEQKYRDYALMERR